MPAKRKRKAAAASSAAAAAAPEPEANFGPSEDEDEGGDSDGDFDVDFDFFDPNEDDPADFHSVNDLIRHGMWDFVDVNYSELADSIVGLGNIGTLIKSQVGEGKEKDDTVCGLLTALNFKQFKEKSWPKVIGDALVARAKKHAEASVAQKLQALLESQDEGSQVGLILSERFANLPPALVPPLHKALQDDIEWSCSTEECPKEEQVFYRFTHFVGVARCHKGGAAAEGPRKKRKGADGEAAAPSGALQFQRPEDEAYVKEALLSFSFPMPVKDGLAKKGEKQEWRTVFAITQKAFGKVVKALPTLEALA